MSSAGRSPVAKRISATCDPDRRAEASFAAKAIAPKRTAEHTMSSRARSVAFDIVTRGRISMSEVRYREATPADADAIIEFQVEMARETEDVALEREVTTRGVHAVFADPSHGRYFVAESGGRTVASLKIGRA